MRIPRHLCRHPKKWTLRHIFQAFFLAVLSVLVLVPVLLYLFPFFTHDNHTRSLNPNGQQQQERGNHEGVGSRRAKKSPSFNFLSWNATPLRRLSSSAITSRRAIGNWKETSLALLPYSEDVGGKCSMYNCFDIHRCGKDGHHRLSVYLYPVERWEVDGVLINPRGLSADFLQFLDALRKSPYLVEDPDDACIFVPTIDTLQMRDGDNLRLLTALSSLPYWGTAGQNHLFISMFSQNVSLLSLKTDAIVAASGFPIVSFRPGFYVPLISYNPILQSYSNISLSKGSEYFRNRGMIAISLEGGKKSLADKTILDLDFCKGRPANYWERCKGSRVFPYPRVLSNVDFCIISQDLSSPILWEVMSVGCIPVIIAPLHRLPFDEVIDWRRNAILVSEHQIEELSSILKSVGERKRRRLKAQVELTFHKYFHSMTHITNTLLEVLQDRVFTHHARTIDFWNRHSILENVAQPLFNPVIAPKEGGFTAVILAYERVPSLFQVIQRLSAVPSLAKIIVVWNNQNKPPPSHSLWPTISKELKLIQMKENKMSNRFFPFDEIETEAVFSLDDDIIMLTVDEIEFGFQTWREFPDRIVGFPSRSHVWDNSSQKWKYESEWTNQISMVLTGASFYHKYWHHSYTYEMFKNIKDLVDAKMNCEDIAMNFLVSATTGQPPIKVTPRKKFKCPTCSNNEMLSSDSSHMLERSECINYFALTYGYMPLISAEFRADPVLFKVDNLPKKLRKFGDIGSL